MILLDNKNDLRCLRESSWFLTVAIEELVSCGEPMILWNWLNTLAYLSICDIEDRGWPARNVLDIGCCVWAVVIAGHPVVSWESLTA